MTALWSLSGCGLSGCGKDTCESKKGPTGKSPSPEKDPEGNNNPSIEELKGAPPILTDRGQFFPSINRKSKPISDNPALFRNLDDLANALGVDTFYSFREEGIPPSPLDEASEMILPVLDDLPVAASIMIISDWQLVDFEDEKRATGFDGTGRTSDALRSNELYNVYAVNALLYAARLLYQEGRIDFLFLAGDLADNASLLELDLIRRLLDGKVVEVGSGRKEEFEDPRTGKNIFEPFRAFGVGDLPYGMVAGNHDGLILGGALSPDITDVFLEPYRGDWPSELVQTYLGTRDCASDCDLAPPDSFVPFDLRREPIFSLNRFVENFLTMNHPPVGWTTDETVASLSEIWEYRLSQTPPILFMGVDTVDREGKTHLGRIDLKTLEELDSRIRQAEREGDYLILGFHHPADSILLEATGEMNFHEYLKQYSNLLAVFTGHSHTNRVTLYPAEEGSPPENKYAEFLTSAVADYPSQFRIVDIIPHGSMIYLRSTMGNFGAPPDSLAETFRNWTFAEWEAGWGGSAAKAGRKNDPSRHYPHLQEGVEIDTNVVTAIPVTANSKFQTPSSK